MQDMDCTIPMQQLNPSSPHPLVSGIPSGVDPAFASVQQDNIEKIIFGLQNTISRSVNGEGYSKLCPVFRVNERPPIDGFMKQKRQDPTRWLANQPHFAAPATQDQPSALASIPSSGDLGWFASISNHKTLFYQLLYLGSLCP